MSLIRWSPRSSFPTNLNSLLDNFFTTSDDIFNIGQRTESLPAVNVSETDDNFVLELAAPGKSKDDFDVDISNGVITISTESEEKSETEEKNYTRKEYSFNSFSRSFSLPDNVEASGIRAKYNEGVLTVDLPKNEPSKPETTKVEVS